MRGCSDAGLFGGLPGAGATMRTVVNVRAGGRTPLSGALHALDMTDVPMIDFTASRAIDDMLHDAQDMGRAVFLVGARPAVSGMLQKQGVLRQLAEGHQYDKRIDALNHAARLIGAQGATA